MRLWAVYTGASCGAGQSETICDDGKLDCKIDATVLALFPSQPIELTKEAEN